ncbi:WD40 repeat-like protein [Schizophyllum commune Loenen D]|nr:WD40 repeat-like protein [Schizophyllum commune Loenen D]
MAPTNATEGPTRPRKRARRDSASTSSPSSAPTTSTSTSTSSPTAPRLFAPFRALGIITNHVPFALQARSHKGAVDGPRVHLLTSVGRSYALWEANKMTLLFVGTPAPQPIAALAMDGDAVWVAAGARLIKYLRGKEVLRAGNPHGQPLATATIFGNQILSLEEGGGRLLVFSTKDGELVRDIEFASGFTATRLLHPATYLNKVLVASAEGGMELWNIKDGVRIYVFDARELSPGPSASAVTALVQAPAVDVVGIGFADGSIAVHDVRADERLLSFRMGTGSSSTSTSSTGASFGADGSSSPIRALAFRTDGAPILASADASGALAIWDLNAPAKLLHLVHGAHDAGVTSLEWVPGQPLLISGGEDNSVKQWLFDAPSASPRLFDAPTSSPRLLKSRTGHRAPPTLVRFYGEDGKQVLTAGPDRALRLTSLVRESRGCEMSQGRGTMGTHPSSTTPKPKLAPITSLASSTAHAKDWDDVVTAHAGDRFARTWSTQNKRLGRYALEGEGVVKATALTACGTFALAGGAGGVVRMWNAQSGVLRRVFKVGDLGNKGDTGATGSSGLGAASGSSSTRYRKQSDRTITGIATDALNTVLVASTLDGTINFFDFHTADLLHTLTITPLSQSTTSSNSASSTSFATASTSYTTSYTSSSASYTPSPTPPAITALHLHRDSGLLAVPCDDLAVRVVDLETRAVVRVLRGFGGRVMDVTFSPDARWLVAASLDAAIRTFDVPSGRLIDVFRCVNEAAEVPSAGKANGVSGKDKSNGISGKGQTNGVASKEKNGITKKDGITKLQTGTPSTPTSVAFSPAGDFLATTHVDSVGVFLWVNRAQFTDVSLHGVADSAGAAVVLPGMQGDAEEEALDALSALTVQDPIADLPPTATPPQLSGDLVTLTLLPRARWMTLLNLDVIQLRNKPKEPPKAPEKAPFFLPTVPGVNPTFDLSAAASANKGEDSEAAKISRRLDSLESGFVRALTEEGPDGSYDPLFTLIKTLSPPALDAELRSMTAPAHQARLLRALTQRLRARRDFEAVQAVMGVVLRIWGESLVGSATPASWNVRAPLDGGPMHVDDEAEELKDALAELREVQAKESERVLGLVAASLGTLGFIRETL